MLTLAYVLELEGVRLDQVGPLQTTRYADDDAGAEDLAALLFVLIRSAHQRATRFVTEPFSSCLCGVKGQVNRVRNETRLLVVSMVFSTHHASSEEPRPVPYRAAVDVPHELVEHVSRLIYPPRRERRSRWRKPSCFQQALLALVHLRKNETLPALAAGFGISTATAWRYADEILDVPAAWAPGLHEALTGPGEGDHVIAGATLRTPYYHQCGQPEHYQQFNRDHARLRAPGERAFAQLKSWRLLRRARCSTRRIGTIVQAVHTLLTCSCSG